ncbi:hypothetical protein O3297_19070 [Janthinobacterium sp. SUN128]|uniref:PRTase-CE domain-containing protein n=1 Tax=Janthinobacterium lividum TaxID=29581 RepID=A0ABU0XTQ7_9BURK|nr:MULTISPECIES: hypothetical protein [Janthinobacterium]MDO8035523.1 hypothetical protein [Janthinobacterium sp. SUN128]MDQ4626718.1 hypothetical protein [Janthinobacterium lividum]MDQ4674315.1 hypothetical protein [Janthinobacterium lividum]MDQ4685046.1 hypothetical protein [Janthinobacterium lividum]
MSLAAVKISPEALKDMMDLFSVQPWLMNLHEEMVALWNLCETREEQNLVKSLVSKICILDAAKELLACRGINQKIQNWNLVPNNTWIVAAANNNEIDGSTAGLQRLKNKIEPADDWHARFVGNIPSAVDKIKDGQNVVIFDDFIGSGDKLIKKRKWLASLLEKRAIVNINYYYIAFSAMKFGFENIENIEEKRIYAHFLLNKGISETYPKDEAEKMIDVMINLESRLGLNYKNKKIEQFSLGYGKSEALYCAENDNCPNNVFPILWWPNLKNGKTLKTLLKRVG